MAKVLITSLRLVTTLLLYLALAVEAFAPTTTFLLCRRQERATCSFLQLIQGPYGHDDFAKIFGKQQDEERRLREMASEYRPMPKQQQRDLYFDADDQGDKDIASGAAATTTSTNTTITTNATKEATYNCIERENK